MYFYYLNLFCVFLASKEITQDRYLVPCTSTRFEKRYIEMDEEILSTVTDIDGNFNLSDIVSFRDENNIS